LDFCARWKSLKIQHFDQNFRFGQKFGLRFQQVAILPKPLKPRKAAKVARDSLEPSFSVKARQNYVGELKTA
jgi:hypothetical protein